MQILKNYKTTVEPAVESLYFRTHWIDTQLGLNRPVWTWTPGHVRLVSVTSARVSAGNLILDTDCGPMIGNNCPLQAMERDEQGYWVPVAYSDFPSEEKEDYYHDPKTVVEMQDWLMSIED